MACNSDFFNGLLFSFSEDEPNRMADNAAPTKSHKQHPLLNQSTSEETAEDVFDSLDAFLASEFPELESECIAKLPAETGSACLKANSCSPVLPAVPALSSSSTDSHTISAVPAATATGHFTCAASAPAAAESAAAAAAAAAAAKAQAQAFAMPASFTSPFAAEGTGALDVIRASSTTSTVAAATAPIPRWKLYHMQQRQELLAPKSKAPKLQCVIPAASAAAATTALPASNNSCGSPVSVVSGACISPTAASLSSAASMNSSFALPQTITAEQLLILNLQQQQQHCTAAALISGKRSFGETITVVPCAAKKRSRITAAGNTAAQHLYGLAVEPSAQLQTLQALQLQLQQQIQQNYQQQAELYQQQQLQALHQQLHLRLAVQQHQYQPLTAPAQVRHKRQTARTVAGKQ